MALMLPDGHPVSEAEILSGGIECDLVKEIGDESNYFYTFTDPDDATQPLGPMACRPSSDWSAGHSSTVRGTTLYPISHVRGPSQVDETWTLTAEWTVTKGTEVEGRAGVSLGVLEAQTHLKLNATITTSIKETDTIVVKKGMILYLAVQIIYRQTDLTRTAYAGPNCHPYVDRATVLTPVNYAVLVARGH